MQKKEELFFPSRLPDSRFSIRTSNRNEQAIIDQALAILDGRLRTSTFAFKSPEDTRSYLRLQSEGLEYEVFSALFLDNRHRLISYDRLFYGTIDGAAVYPREVVKRALAHNAAAVIFSHNHPSGVAEPSAADQSLTRRLREALGLVDIRILDHVVVGAGDCVSFAERGLL